MAKLKLFQTVILWHPTEKQEKDGQKSKIIQEPKYVLEKDEKTAAMRANFSIPEEYRDQLDQVEVLVVNF